MIKKCLLLLLVLPWHGLLMAQAGKDLSNKIEEVTVFLSGAEIHRQGNTTLNAGPSEIVLTGLSPSIDPGSVQVKGKGNFIILSVNHKLNYLNELEKPKEIKTLEDSIAALNTHLKILGGMEGVYNNEESMLLANKSIGNKDVGVDAVDLAEVADLFRKRLLEINEKRIEVQEEIVKVREQIGKLNNQLATLNGKRNRTTGEISITVSAKERTPAKFEVSYFVTGAGWKPNYDLRAESTTAPVTLNYKAQVFQNSGEDWEKAILTLSTLNPKRSGIQPVLSPWTLRYQSPVAYRSTDYSRSYSKAGQAPMAVQERPMMDKEVMQELPGAETAAQYTSVSDNTTGVQFRIGLPYTIPADNQMHDVAVATHELKATFTHFAVPKIDLDAFLLASVTGWEGYNMLPGNANIYFEGTFVGRSFINTKTTDDTLKLSFGRDQSVNITREKVKDFDSKKFLGDNKKETFTYEIAVRNTKKVPVKLVLEDQVPLSSNKEIVIDIEDISGAKMNEVTGKVQWTLDLQGGESKKMKLSYSVKYPKDKIIGNL